MKYLHFLQALEEHFQVQKVKKIQFEASSHDRIKMTKFWLEYDPKFFTPMNVNIGT